MESKYQILKKALKKAAKHWDAHPLSGSAKADYLAAKGALVDYYNKVLYK